MNFRLPDIKSRGNSPTSWKVKSRNSRPISSFSTIKSRAESISPTRKDSNELISNIRTISDDVNSSKSQCSVLGKLNNMFFELDKKTLKKSVRPRLLRNKQKTYKEVTKALFTLTNTTKSKIQATAVANLFVSCGYTSNYEALGNMFKSVFLCDSFELINFGKGDVLAVFEDAKLDNILRALIGEFKNADSIEKDEEFDYLLMVVHRWWIQLDRSKNGFVATEDICKFLIQENMFESSVDLKKIFHKMKSVLTFSNFFGIFGRALFKFLLLRLCDDAASETGVSPDIVINEKRRRMMINGIIGKNRTFETLNKYSSIN